MNIRNFLCVAAIATMLASCAKENDIDQLTQAPNLPNVESMVLPLDILNELDTVGIAEEGEVEFRASYKNWTYAAVNLFVWNSIVLAEMAIPIATLAEAFNHDPYEEGNAYVWAYDIQDEGDHYFLKLYATLGDSDNEIDWKMVVDLEGKYSDFTFYTGTTTMGERNASWTIYGAPQNPFPFLQVDYEVVSNEEATIRYTNVIPGHKDQGNYIEARSYASGEMSRHYDINKGSAEDFLQIRWNEPNHYGQVSEQKHFGDNDWHCWDELGRDTSCN